MTDSSTQRSVPAPNHTQTPNAFFDEILPQIDTMSELKVTLAIIRQTFGWHKDEDQISLKQLEELTGMKRQQVVAGCKAALKRGYVWNEKRGGRNYFGLHVGGYDGHTPQQRQGYEEHTSSQYDGHTHKRKEKESITPTGKAAPSQKTWGDSTTGEKQAYLIAYLHQRLNERGLETPTPGYKERLSGEVRTYINKGRSKADLLFALDHIVSRWSDNRLEFWRAMGDVDAQTQRKHLRVVGEAEPEYWYREDGQKMRGNKKVVE